MGGSTAWQALTAQPLTCAVAALCTGIFAWMWNTRRDTDLAHVALSYQRVVVERQYYRVVTATLCHVNAMHLLFNMGTLLSLGPVEARLGAAGYLRHTLLLLLLCKAVFLGATHAVVARAPPDVAARWRESSAVGYSGVLFGWMTLQAVAQPGSAIALPGGLALPFSLAPFVSLLVNQLLVPQASFLGHLAGIVAGYALAWGLLDWCAGYWFWSGLGYAALAALVSARAHPAAPRWLRRLVDVSPEFSAATGGLGGGGAVATARRYMAGGVLRVVATDTSGAIEFDAGSTAAARAGAGAGGRAGAAGGAGASSPARGPLAGGAAAAATAPAPAAVAVAAAQSGGGGAAPPPAPASSSLPLSPWWQWLGWGAGRPPRAPPQARGAERGGAPPPSRGAGVAPGAAAQRGPPSAAADAPRGGGGGGGRRHGAQPPGDGDGDGDGDERTPFVI
jgi:membrane associated rhomboid family serine protease